MKKKDLLEFIDNAIDEDATFYNFTIAMGIFPETTESKVKAVIKADNAIKSTSFKELTKGATRSLQVYYQPFEIRLEIKA